MGRTDGAATATYHIGRGTFDLGIFYFYPPFQARILFETFFGVEGVESLPRSCAKEFRLLGLAPLFYHNPVSQVGTYSRSAGQLQVSVLAGIPHPFKCAAAAIQLLSHPLLAHPQTHPVGVRTRYHTPFLSPRLIYHTDTPKHTLWVFGDVLSYPLVCHTPLGPPASCNLSPGVHKISHPPQDTTPRDNILKSQKCYLRGVLSCVSYGLWFINNASNILVRSEMCLLFVIATKGTTVSTHDSILRHWCVDSAFKMHDLKRPRSLRRCAESNGYDHSSTSQHARQESRWIESRSRSSPSQGWHTHGKQCLWEALVEIFLLFLPQTHRSASAHFLYVVEKKQQ